MLFGGAVEQAHLPLQVSPREEGVLRLEVCHGLQPSLALFLSSLSSVKSWYSPTFLLLGGLVHRLKDSHFRIPFPKESRKCPRPSRHSNCVVQGSVL